MPIPRSTNLTAYEFTDMEFYAATRLSELNLMLLQDLIAEKSAEKARLIVELKEAPNSQEAIIRFIQREAELTGEIGAYMHLVDLFANTQQPTAVPQPQNQE